VNALAGLLKCKECGTPMERTSENTYACPKCPKNKGGKITTKGDGVQFQIDGKDIFNS